MDIAGASALVTGAGRGIGRAIALALAREGAFVMALARTAREVDAVVEEIRGHGGRGASFIGDLRDRQVSRRAVEEARTVHGRLQVLVNNAGIGGHSAVADTSEDEWDRILDTNVGAAFRLTRAALPQLADGGGHVFMISSLAGSNAIAGMAAYCASKAALDHFSQCLMLEVRHQGVKVTTIAPGSVDTTFGGGPRTAAEWMLKPGDVAQAVIDLLRTRDEAHLSRVEMRPLRPARRT